MDWYLIATGFGIGLAVAVPVGPVNLMCIQRTLQHGFWSGVATGIGAAIGDGVFAVVAAFSLTWLSQLIQGHSLWIQGIGGVVLIGMGLRTMVLPPARPRAEANQHWLHHGGMVGTTFLLAITNPATFFGFFAIFSGLKGLVTSPGDYLTSGVLVASVVAGSFFWWTSIAWVASRLRRRFNERGIRLTNRISGVVILAFGVLVMLDLMGLQIFGDAISG